MRASLLLVLLAPLAVGCSAFPEAAHQPLYHNPFPQLSRVAVLPFFNQSADPTVDQDEIALHYFNELQAIRGFEVMPVGVAKQLAAGSGIPLQSPADFQALARYLGVDAVVVGSVTEYSPYYPPRMGLAVRWYAANPGFHPIPPGYGLPWGSAEEEFIPNELLFEAEFALAKEQLKTQTPAYEVMPRPVGAVDKASYQQPAAAQPDEPDPVIELAHAQLVPEPSDGLPAAPSHLPPDWPDPRGFIPPAPSPHPPTALPQLEPVMSLTRVYHGNDAEFTKRLSNYYHFRDDARFGGWQASLERSDDFVRFCCHLHIAELLAARGGAGETRVVWRWPISRYEP